MAEDTSEKKNVVVRNGGERLRKEDFSEQAAKDQAQLAYLCGGRDFDNDTGGGCVG